MAEKKDDALDFAVPGQNEEAGQDSVYQAEQENAADRSNISLFWLLQHYSKENAAAYKMQQSKKKEKKKKKKSIESTVLPTALSPNKEEMPRVEKIYRDREEENFGGTVYLNRESRQDPEELTVRAASLECLGYGQTVPVDHLPFLIGRSSTGVDLCIADNKTVGRMHAVISYHNGAYYIKDLKSLNHVYLNGKRIPPEKEIRLNDGTKITLGNEDLVFRCV